jgi:hypothetical protein
MILSAGSSILMIITSTYKYKCCASKTLYLSMYSVYKISTVGHKHISLSVYPGNLALDMPIVFPAWLHRQRPTFRKTQHG